MATGHDREYVQSLERGLDVIRTFDAANTRMTLSEIAGRAALTRAAARRFLLTLLKLGYIGTDGKLFWLKPRILDLGYRYLSSLRWWQMAQPIIEEISHKIGESCSISVLDGEDIVYVARAQVYRILSSTISIGSRYPAFCTAMGRAILAHLPEPELATFLSQGEFTRRTDQTVIDAARLRKLIVACRSRGYALADEELEVNLRGMAVPILGGDGRPIASLGISVYVRSESADSLVKRGLPALLEGAARIAATVP